MKAWYRKERIELESHSTGCDVARALKLTEPQEALALLLDKAPCDLSTPITEGSEIDFVSFEDPLGKAIFWHTSAHVLAQAVLRLWPEAIPTIGPPIEQGFYYDFANLQLTEEDFGKIEAQVRQILKEGLVPKRLCFEGKKEALDVFSANLFKKELIEGFAEDAPITAYRQGEFLDLCRGPHLPSLGKIKAFKVLKTSGAYWKGDSNNPSLTRIYGIAFPDRALLKEYLFQQQEAQKRDHRRIGKELDLFSFHVQSPAMPFIHPKGLFIWNQLIHHLREQQASLGYEEIKTPQIMDKTLWEQSGHWDHYRENMFLSKIDEKVFAIKPMNCPGCMLYYLSKAHSYRDFPKRVAEIGHVHRYEASGAVNGLFRVRSFHQDDAHIFMQESDIEKEVFEVLRLADKLYSTFGLTYSLELSTRPKKEKTVGSDEEWDAATQGLTKALEAWGHPFRINEGDGAFYGPKIDLHIKDALKRSWQCGTVQLDFSLPKRFDLQYKSKEGLLKRPIMIHRALYGSIERFFGVLIEHFAGKFPLWLSPQPFRLLPVADVHLEYADKICAQIRAAGFLCEVDASPESIGKKVRQAQLQKVNYMLTIGDREVDNQTVSLRTRDNVVHGEVAVGSFVDRVREEYDKRLLDSPFTRGG